MAGLEVSIKYHSLAKKQAVGLCIGWVAVGVLAVCLLHQIFGVLDHFTVLNNVWYAVGKVCFAMVFTLFYAYVPFALQQKYRRGNCISANKDGLGVPAPLLGRPLWLPWSELRSADIVHFGFWDALRLTFGAKKVVWLSTKKMSENDLEQILMAIEVWAVNASCSQALLDFKDALQDRKVGIEQHGYTRLWEEELHRRFNCTTFVPHEPGSTLRSGKLTIVRQMAFGGFSAVYLAEDSHKNKIVVKESVTPLDSESNQKASEFFKREADLLARLNNDHIAKIIDNFVENGRTYLVLEYIPGETLREYIKHKGSQSEETVLKWMLEMATILEYLHDQDPPVIHRDFTPDNIVLTPDRSLVLIDFGAANEFLGTATGTLVGKQAYMPPEQVRGKCEPRSDLYALGCTAHFLLTGKDPEPLSMCNPLSSVPNLSSELNVLIANLTQQGPAERISTASALIREIQGIATGSNRVSLTSRQKEHVER